MEREASEFWLRRPLLYLVDITILCYKRKVLRIDNVTRYILFARKWGSMPNHINKQARIENCTFCKAILMLLVILNHCCAFWTGTWFNAYPVMIKADYLKTLCSWLGSFHVYGFTLVSGYLFFYLKNEAGKYVVYSLFLKNKVKRLLIPYCFTMICWVAPISKILCSYSWTTVLEKYILCTSPSQLWFLWMLFDVFLVVWPLNNLLKKDLLAIIVCLASWGIGLIGSQYLPNVFCIWTAFDYLPFFIIGMKLREKDGLQLAKIPACLWIILDVILFAVLQYISNYSEFIIKVISYGLEYVLHIVGALMAFFVLQKIATKVDWKNSKVFMFLAKRSMPVYLFHQQIIYFVIIWLNGKVNPYINAVANFLIALSVSLIISSILMKFKVTRILIGEK